MKCYRDLIVWQQGVDLVVDIYRLAGAFPVAERYALHDQMQRAAVSIPANIAEGHARSSRKEFLHFLSITLGSLAELDTHLTIANKPAYIAEGDMRTMAGQLEILGKKIRALQKSLNNKDVH